MYSTSVNEIYTHMHILQQGVCPEVKNNQPRTQEFVRASMICKTKAVHVFEDLTVTTTKTFTVFTHI